MSRFIYLTFVIFLDGIYIKTSRRNRNVAFFRMEHPMGIGPTQLAWEANVLPLNYGCMCK